MEIRSFIPIVYCGLFSFTLSCLSLHGIKVLLTVMALAVLHSIIHFSYTGFQSECYLCGAQDINF